MSVLCNPWTQTNPQRFSAGSDFNLCVHTALGKCACSSSDLFVRAGDDECGKFEEKDTFVLIIQLDRVTVPPGLPRSKHTKGAR